MTHPPPVDLPPMPAKTTCEVKFTDKAQIGQTVTMPFGHTDEALQAFAQLAVLAERERCARIADDESSIREQAGLTHPEGSESRGRCFAAARAAANVAVGIRNGEVPPALKAG